eukprot:jgi/Ulvmu1/1485/UM011_0215.1
MAMLCLEWWAVEVCTLVSGTLRDAELSLAVTGLCINIVACAFMVPLGICQGARIRVTNLLGSGKENAAMRITGIALTVCAVAVALYLALLIPGRAALSRVFLPHDPLDSAIAQAFMRCLLLVAAMAPADWVNSTLAGVLQSTGHQAVGAYIYVGTYWCAGPPALWCFTFYLGWGVYGIWATLTVLANLQVLCMSAVVWTIDWPYEVERSLGLISAQAGPAGARPEGAGSNGHAAMDDSCGRGAASEPLLPHSVKEHPPKGLSELGL